MQVLDGHGDHPTTIGCLLALEKPAQKFYSDRGRFRVGDRDLAIAVRRLWPSAQVITTYRSVAVETAHQNMERNRVRDTELLQWSQR